MRYSNSIFRSLLLVALFLGHPEDSAAQFELPCPQPVTGPIDLFDLAPGAVWTSGSGSVTFGTLGSPMGAAGLNSGLVEGGLFVAQYLHLQPDQSPGTQRHWIRGDFPSLIVPLDGPLVKFEAAVAFLDASTSDGMSYRFILRRGGEDHILAEVDSRVDGVFTCVSADLTSFRGETVQIALEADDGGTGDFQSDIGAVLFARIVNHGEVLYDFVTEASNMTWTNGSGTTITFDAPPGPDGGARHNTADYEDGLCVFKPIALQPELVLRGSIEGRDDAVTVGATKDEILFLGRVGFPEESDQTSGLTFEFEAETTSRIVRSVFAEFEGLLNFISADLTHVDGISTNYLLRTHSAGLPTAEDEGGWTEAKLIGYDPHLVYDFVENASNPLVASWETGSGSISFGGTGPGSTSVASGFLEDGVMHTDYLLTIPNDSGPENFIRGQFDSVIIPHNLNDIRFVAEVGYEQNAQSTDLFEYRVFVLRHGATAEFLAEEKSTLGQLDSISVNLSGYQGEIISILVEVDGLSDAVGDRVAFVRPRLVGKRPRQLFIEEMEEPVDHDALLKAAHFAEAMSPSEIYFDPRTYTLDDKLTLRGVDNLVFNGSRTGTTQLMLNNRLEGLLDIGASSVNIGARDFTIDYTLLPFTQGVINTVSNNDINFTVDPGYPEFDSCYFHDPSFTEGHQSWGMAHLPDPPYSLPHGAISFTPLATPIPCDAGAGSTFNITVANPTGMTPGRKISWRRRSGGNLFFQANSEEGHFWYTRLTIHSCPNMVFLAIGVEKLFVRDCRIERLGDRIMTSNGDGIHARSCKHGPDVIGNMFENLTDDAININNQNFKITQVIDPLNYEIDTFNRPLHVGDHLYFFRKDPGKLGELVEVVAFVKVPMTATLYLITVDRDPFPSGGGAQVDDLFINDDWDGDRYLVHGNIFQVIRGHGIRGQASFGTISDNQFSVLAMGGIDIKNTPENGIGSIATDLQIHGNTIVDCCFDFFHLNRTDAGPVRIAGEADTASPFPVLSEDPLHKRIKIENNMIRNWPHRAIFVGSASEVTIHRNNEMTHDGEAAFPSESRGWLGTTFCENAQQIQFNNNVVDDQRSEGFVNGIHFIKGATSLSTNGNSYTIPKLPSVPEILTVTDCDPLPITTMVASIAAEDGYITESSTTPGVGGTVKENATGGAGLLLGDVAADLQRLTILSFDTSGLPDDAIVLGATLRLVRGQIIGPDPWGALGPAQFDVVTGFFGTSVALEPVDFESVATESDFLSLPSAPGSLLLEDLPLLGYNAINTAGSTQFRMRFQVPTNGDGVLQNFGFFPGGSGIRQPELEITYLDPTP